METVKDTLDRSPIQQKRFLLVSAGLMLALAIALLTFSSKVELICDRSALATCKLVQANLIDRRETAIPIASLQAAELQSRKRGGREGREDIHRVILRTDSQEIPLTPYLASELISPLAKKQAIVDEVNTFLRSPETSSLSVSSDDRWFFQIGAIVLIIGSAIFGLLAWRTVIPESIEN